MEERKDGKIIEMCEYTKQWQAHAEAKGIEIGETRGEFKKAIELIRNLMENSHVSADVAMNMLGISKRDQQIYLPKLI